MVAHYLLQNFIVATALGAAVTGDVRADRFVGRSGKETKKVVLVHDACIEDFLSMAILGYAHKQGQIELLGSVAVNADSALPYSVKLTYKMHKALDIMDVPISLSKARLFNDFPWQYKADSLKVYELKEAAAIDVDIPHVFMDGDTWLEATLENAAENSITIAHLTSITNLGELFKRKPHLTSKVAEIIWMAGAIDVRGNLDKKRIYEGFNEKAEFNVFGDAYNAAWLMENTQIPISLFPLDFSNKVPVQGEFMHALKEQEHCNPLVYNLLYQAFHQFAAPSPWYRLWDSSTVLYIIKPELYDEPETLKLTCVTDWKNQGWLAQKGAVQASRWRDVQVFFNFTRTGKDQFYRYAANAACHPRIERALV